MKRKLRWVLPVAALAMLIVGAWIALKVTPPDREMGDVYRIFYAHVPCMWMAMFCLMLNFGAAVFYLFRPSWTADALAESFAEVGLLFGFIGVVLGSIWARPTWGVYWNWDPRLTTVAIMLVAYSGYLALRKFVEDPEKRAVWSAVVAIIAAVDVPVVYFSVRWWRSLHQTQSSPSTVDPRMLFGLYWNLAAFTLVTGLFVWSRYRIARAARARELAPPPEVTELPEPNREPPSPTALTGA